MRIMDSTLGMEASSSHMEVIGRTTRNTVKEQRVFQFNKNLFPPLSEDLAPVTSTSARSNLIEDVFVQDLKTRDILEKTVSELLGSKARVSGLGKNKAHGRYDFRYSSEYRKETIDNSFFMNLGGVRFHEESERLQFSSSGLITAADGREIEFSLSLQIEKRELHVSSLRGRLPFLLDPLVLSFEDGFDTLLPTSFYFDLDGDGQLDEINSLGSGSGFLSMDLNKDGIINDGMELFGPLTGSGYGELSKYDNDNNNWIDENDPIFEQLLVWKGAGSEEEELLSLREAGVGALSLSSVESMFDLKDKNDALLGQVTRSGIFILENGEAKSLQELELNVKQESLSREEKEPVITISDALERLYVLLKRQEDLVQRMADTTLMRRTRQETLYQRFWHFQGVEDRLRG